MNDFIFKFHYREKPFQFVLSVKKKKKKKKGRKIFNARDNQNLYTFAGRKLIREYRFIFSLR